MRSALRWWWPRGRGLGCGGGSAITSRTGEVHIHQYPTGAHIEALFVDPPTPIEETDFDSTLPVRNPPILNDGDCRTYKIGGCSSGDCRAPELVDGGRVRIEGLPQAVDMSFLPQFGSYSDPVVDDGMFLRAGMVAKVTGLGGGRVPPFESQIDVPTPIVPTSTLESGIASGLEVSWTPAGDGSRVKLLLNVVPASGDGGTITCYVDEALGRYRLPDAAIALLPPPPHTLQLEVNRYRLVEVPIGAGGSIVMHSGFAVLSATSVP